MQALAFFLDNIGWVLVNILVPVILPPAGLLLARLMPLPPAARARTRIVTTVENGQLGWLALAWSAAAIYEAWQFMAVKQSVFAWIAILLGCEIVLVLVAMFMAVGGAVAARHQTRISYFFGSIIVAGSSAAALVATHFNTLS